MTEICEVVITADNADWLAEFTRRLVEDRLAACGQQIASVRSIYRWQGEVHDEPEARVPDRRQPFVEESAASGDEAIKVWVNGDRQGAALFQLPQRLSGDESFLKRSISPASHHPDVASAQSVAQFR